MKKELFKESFSYLQELFDCDLSENKVKIYWNSMKEMSDEMFEKAIKGIIQNYKYSKFPLPAVFFQYSHDDLDVRAQMAVSAVRKAVMSVGSYKSVSFGDAALHSVIKRYGGWVDICLWGPDDWKINEGRFLVAYKAAVSFGDVGPEYLAGTYESLNGSGEFEKYNNMPVLVDHSGKKISVVKPIEDKNHDLGDAFSMER